MNTERSAAENRTLQLAFGRIMRMAARPEQPGDDAEYERCKWIMLDILAPSGPEVDTGPNYARDYGKGAQGDW